jgi:Holliday junction DNA helicase RuvA
MALTSLGYSQSEAVMAIRKVDNSSDMDTEQLLKAALKKMI